MSAAEQREIVTVRYPVSEHPHPAVVLSPVEANYDWVACVMITSNGMDDDLSFHLKNDMTDRPMSKTSQVRLHMLGGFEAENVTRDARPNKMTVSAFRKLIKAINDVTFGKGG